MGVLPHCDEIMVILMENLSNNDVHRQVKPQILSVFGDIALAIGTEFKKYLDVVMQTLLQASQAQVDRVRTFADSRWLMSNDFKSRLNNFCFTDGLRNARLPERIT